MELLKKQLRTETRLREATKKDLEGEQGRRKQLEEQIAKGKKKRRLNFLELLTPLQFPDGSFAINAHMIGSFDLLEFFVDIVTEEGIVPSGSISFTPQGINVQIPNAPEAFEIRYGEPFQVLSPP